MTCCYVTKRLRDHVSNRTTCTAVPTSPDCPSSLVQFKSLKRSMLSGPEQPLEGQNIPNLLPNLSSCKSITVNSRTNVSRTAVRIKHNVLLRLVLDHFCNRKSIRLSPSQCQEVVVLVCKMWPMMCEEYQSLRIRFVGKTSLTSLQ